MQPKCFSGTMFHLLNQSVTPMHPQITNAGSARVLEGSVYVITFFVSEVDWPAGYKMDLFKQMRNAESWLERMAMKYGKTVRFVNGVHGLFEPFETDIVPDYESGNASGEIATKYLSQIGCPLDGYKEWVKKNSGCDQSLVFVIANKEGRGYANLIASGSSDNNPEGAILFHSYNDPLYAVRLPMWSYEGIAEYTGIPDRRPTFSQEHIDQMRSECNLMATHFPYVFEVYDGGHSIFCHMEDKYKLEGLKSFLRTMYSKGIPTSMQENFSTTVQAFEADWKANLDNFKR